MFKILQWHTDQSHPSASIIKDKKGSAVLIFALLITIILLLANIAYVNYRVLLAKRDMVDDAITTSALATLTYADPIQMAYGNIVFNGDPNTFYNFLSKQPMSQYITINKVDFSYNNASPSNPMTAPNGVVVTKPSIYIDATANVTNVLGKPVSFRIQKIVDADYQLNTNIN